MRWPALLLALAACAHTAPPAAPPRVLQPGDPCGTEAPPLDPAANAAAFSGAQIERVCLLGLSPDLVQHFESRLASQAGSVLDADAVQADLEQIYFDALAKDVTALALPFEGVPNQVRLVFLAQTWPLTDELVIDGAGGNDAEVFRHSFERGVAASPSVGKAYALAARYFFIEAGYLDATAEPAFEALPSGAMRLRLKVTLGLRRVVRSIRFDGVQSVPHADLSAALADLIGAPYVRRVAAHRRNTVLNLGYDHGLIEARVTEAFEPKPTGVEPGAVELVFHLEEGAVYHLAAVSLVGDAFPAAAKVLAGLRSKPKAVYSYAGLDEDEQKLKALGQRTGLSVQTSRRLDFHVESKTVDVVFTASRVGAR